MLSNLISATCLLARAPFALSPLAGHKVGVHPIFLKSGNCFLAAIKVKAWHICRFPAGTPAEQRYARAGTARTGRMSSLISQRANSGCPLFAEMRCSLGGIKDVMPHLPFPCGNLGRAALCSRGHRSDGTYVLAHLATRKQWVSTVCRNALLSRRH